MVDAKPDIARVFSLAHLTDPHLTLAGLPPGWRDLPIKRALSRVSWHASRRRVHRPAALRAVVADLRASRPDHVAVTGDLTNLALPAEFDRARAWLAALGGPAAVSVVPGNHDAMLRGSWAAGIGRWSDYMLDDADSAAMAPTELRFPYLQQRGPLALIGVSSAVPSRPFFATGLVGAAQAERFAALLARTGQAGLCRIVLLHHPPVDAHVAERKALLDRSLIRAALAEHGAELVLSGHSHVASLEQLDGPRGPVAVLVGPSASTLPRLGLDPRRFAGWQRVDVEPMPGGWRLRIRRRQLGLDGMMQDSLSVVREVRA